MTLNQIYHQDTLTLAFHALSDNIRLQVLSLLRTKELCVCEITQILNIPQSKLSFHLKALRESNLVNCRQEGRWTYYSLNLSQLVILEQYLADIRRSTVLAPARLCED